MKKSTLYLMFALVGAAFVVVWFGRDGAPPPAAEDPLRLIDFASVDRLSCASAGGFRWSLRPGAGGGAWRLEGTGIPEGEDVAADDELRRRMIGALRDAEPSASRSIADLDLAEWGLAPPALEIELSDGSEIHRLEVGRPDVGDQLYYRAAGGERVFRVHGAVFRDFDVAPRDLRDPRLVEAGYGDVAEISVVGPGERRWGLVRRGPRWAVRLDDGRLARGSQVDCDRFAAGMVATKAHPVQGGAPAGADVETMTLVVRNRAGEEERILVFAVDDEEQTALVRRGDEPDLRRGGRDLWRLVGQRPEDLLDSTLTGFEEAGLSSIRLEGPARAEPLSLRQWQGRVWFVDLEGASPKIDQERFRAFRDRVLNLPFRRRRSDDPAFEPHWRLLFTFDDRIGTPPVTIEIGSPDAEGIALARRSDEEGVVEVDAADLEVLKTRPWELIQLFVTQGRESEIDGLEILENGEEAASVSLETDPDGRRVWLSGRREIPADYLSALLAKLAFLAVSEYLGPPRGAVAEALEAPRWVVRWHRPEGRPSAGAGVAIPEWKEWRIGGLMPDGIHWACTVNTVPGIVFLVRGEELLPVQDALRGIRGS